MTDLEIWDQWFEAVGDEQASREWRAVKKNFTDPNVIAAWARIIEMNRIERRLARPKEETPAEGLSAGDRAG